MGVISLLTTGEVAHFVGEMIQFDDETAHRYCTQVGAWCKVHVSPSNLWSFGVAHATTSCPWDLFWATKP